MLNAWQTKLARLYLLSDVLHNSSAPVRNASRYRAAIQTALPEARARGGVALHQDQDRSGLLVSLSFPSQIVPRTVVRRQVFEALNVTRNALGGESRMACEAFDDKVTGLLAVWGVWSIYPPLFLSGLEATFRRRNTTALTTILLAGPTAPSTRRKTRTAMSAAIRRGLNSKASQRSSTSATPLLGMR